MNNKELYNEIYTKNKHYNHNVMYKYEKVSEFFNRIRNGINSLFQDEISILDAGCGEGWNLRKLKEEGFDVFGIEISDVCCQQFLQDLPHKCTDIISFAKEHLFCDADNLAKDCYTGLLCFDVLEHISYNEIHETISALADLAPQALIGIAHHSDIQFGHELHLIQEDRFWWEGMLLTGFSIVEFKGTLNENFYLFECKA